MALKTDQISKIIKDQIKDFDTGVVVSEVGTVLSAGDGIARVHGLEKVMSLELLEFPHDVYGLAFNLEEDNVGTVLFGEFHKIKEGDWLIHKFPFQAKKLQYCHARVVGHPLPVLSC
jgi:F-type H+-transporting ATPase subunit alpha